MVRGEGGDEVVEAVEDDEAGDVGGVGEDILCGCESGVEEVYDADSKVVD